VSRMAWSAGAAATIRRPVVRCPEIAPIGAYGRHLGTSVRDAFRHPKQGNFVVRLPNRAICAPVAALILALALSGCGRKGGLDPPPGAQLDPALTSNVPPPETPGPDGRPVQPAPGRTSPLDFLLD